MSLPTIVKSDFIADIKIVQTSADSELTNYISVYLTEWLRKIVGSTAYSYIDSTDPLPDRFTDLLAGVSYYNDTLERTVYFEGLTKALRKLIYFEYVRNYYKASHTGLINMQNENSAQAGLLGSNQYAISKFNEASQIVIDGLAFVNNYTNKAWDIDSITDLGGTLRINVSDTHYLVNGDTVTINGTDYVISSLVADTSFVITSALISATEYYFDAFKEIVTSSTKTNYCTIGHIIG